MTTIISASPGWWLVRFLDNGTGFDLESAFCRELIIGWRITHTESTAICLGDGIEPITVGGAYWDESTAVESPDGHVQGVSSSFNNYDAWKAVQLKQAKEKYRSEG
ncbi:hypothetical protein [Methylocapsa aurea]|uniref:hypothetical protein n=1 Tax=Methylocapsa aurea TaxID=663610 RepID=UPI0012EC08A9|nr:hypothetical protein [Methylocapsa aurea]